MYLVDSSPNAIVRQIRADPPRKDETLLILLAEKGRPELTDLVAALNTIPVSFFGGFFPALIAEGRRYDTGAVLIRLPHLAPPVMVAGLDQGTLDLPDFKLPPDALARRPTAIVLVDGLAPNIGAFLAELFRRFGGSIHYLGGGAGSLSLQPMPCLFGPAGAAGNAAIVLFTRWASALGVRHGWEKVAGPVVATRTRRNVIRELNWKNAFAVYQEIVSRDLQTRFTLKQFADVGRTYPFGIVKENAENVVRDPVSVNAAGEIVCVGEIPENTALNILRGRADQLIAAAGQAAADCRQRHAGPARLALVADCISRALYLGDRFADELRAVGASLDHPDSPLEGMLTLGEISSFGEGFLEFFNKTIVVGALFDE